MRFLQASMNVNEVITTYTVVASAFLSAVAFVNSLTQRSVEDLKKDVDGKFADAKKDTDSKFALSFILSGATLATVLYMAAATAAPLTR
jgi:hypothetical protein